MNNVTNLFENLMLMGQYESASKDVKHTRKNKVVKESDSTLLNLSVEIPQDTENISPEDVNVDVGVLNLDTTDADEVPRNDEPTDGEGEDEIEIVDDEGATDDTPSDDENNDDSEDEDKDKDKDKEESLHNRRLEAYKRYKESRQKAKLEGKSSDDKDPKKCNCDKDKKKCKDCDDKSKKESADVEGAKKRILNRVNGKTECSNPDCEDKDKTKKESIARLDTQSLNRLITSFVRDNYKNIDKITISRAILENKQLTLKGTITDKEGKTESIVFKNRGFDTSKLEGKKFLIDFKDSTGTFGIIKESLKQPFTFTATLKNGVLKFESLNCNFKTKLTENKVAQISGKYNLKESMDFFMSTDGSSGISCNTKEEFMDYVSEEIDRAMESGASHFDIEIHVED